MSETKKCPKCNGDMEEGEDLRPVGIHWVSDLKFRKIDDMIGDKIIPFCCKNCGYIELFKKMEKKVSSYEWR
jgi:predicted nucleic-acid-binding Zn-ribbon protein